MMNSNTHHNRRARFHYLFALTLLVVFFSFGPEEVHATSAQTVLSTSIKKQTITRGTTIGTPDQQFLLGIRSHVLNPRKTVNVEVLKITGKQNKQPYNTKKYKIIGPVWQYSLSSNKPLEVHDALWISFVPKKFKENYTLAQWDDTIGKWKPIRFTYSNAGRIQTALLAPHATLAMVVEKKSHRAPQPAQQFTGKASWYYGSGAAMNLLPIGTEVVVKNNANGKHTTVKITSTGPYVAGRIIDLPSQTFSQIADLSTGVIDVSVHKK